MAPDSLEIKGATSHIELVLLFESDFLVSSDLGLSPGGEFNWNTSIAALATVSNHWDSSGVLALYCLNISCKSNQDMRRVQSSKFCLRNVSF